MRSPRHPCAAYIAACPRTRPNGSPSPPFALGATFALPLSQHVVSNVSPYPVHSRCHPVRAATFVLPLSQHVLTRGQVARHCHRSPSAPPLRCLYRSTWSATPNGSHRRHRRLRRSPRHPLTHARSTLATSPAPRSTPLRARRRDAASPSLASHLCAASVATCPHTRTSDSPLPPFALGATFALPLSQHVHLNFRWRSPAAFALLPSQHLLARAKWLAIAAVLGAVVAPPPALHTSRTILATTPAPLLLRAPFFNARSRCRSPATSALSQSQHVLARVQMACHRPVRHQQRRRLRRPRAGPRAIWSPLRTHRGINGAYLNCASTRHALPDSPPLPPARPLHRSPPRASRP